MTLKILVAYATKYGSTKEVAEAIARKITGKSFRVDVAACKEVKSLAGYQAVVIGAPLYAGAFLSDGGKFLNRFQSDLEQIQSALFILGPLNGTQQEIHGVQVQLDANRKKFPSFKPVDEKIFVGALDLKKLRFPDSLIKLYRPAKNNPMKSSDNRDWKVIENWAAALVETLQLKVD
jgi:menaquinone-dependent protoporphyrinogen oxidase